MKIGYHPLVQRDASEIVRYYDRISPHLGDKFWAELMRTMDSISDNPRRFHFVSRGLRRANIGRFPYHVLFRERPDNVRIIVVRHDKRLPTYGTNRR